MAIITVIRIILSEAKSWPCCVLSLLLGGGPHTENFSNSSWSKYCQPKATEYPNHHLLLLLLTSVVCLSLKTPLNYKAFPHRISHRKLTWIKKDSEWVGLEIRLAWTRNPPGSGSSDVGPWPHFRRSTSGDRSLRDLPGRRSPFQLLSWDTLATEIYQLTQQGHRRAEKAWPRWGARWKEERKESYKKKKKNGLVRPTISSCNIQILEPWPKIAAHLLPFPFALAPRNTKREVAEQNASFMRVWRMQASSWLDNPRQPSLNQGAAGVKATGGGSWNPGQSRRTLSVEGPCQAGAAFQVDKGTVPIRNECLRQKSLSTARSQRLFS